MMKEKENDGGRERDLLIVGLQRVHQQRGQLEFFVCNL